MAAKKKKRPQEQNRAPEAESTATEDNNSEGKGTEEKKTGNDMIEMVIDYLRRGWSVMKLPPRSKEPYNKPFTACVINQGNVHTLTEEDNIAVLFSTAGGLKDFDCDYQSAADLAEAVGLEGAAFGRESGVRHYLFDAPGCEAKEFKLPEANDYPRELPIHNGEPSYMVLEIRGNTNTYTMAPPSTHPCGEKLKWVTNREPVKTTPAELRALAGRHAVAAATLHFYPDSPSARFEVRMALTGALIRSGMPADQVGLYVQVVAKLGGDPKWKENFAERTEKRINADKKTTGLTKLIETLQLPGACLGVFYEWLHDTGAGQEGPSDPQPLTRPLPPPEPFPLDAMGDGLSQAAQAISDIVQSPIEMCASAVLSSTSFAVSAHVDIKLPTGETKPVSNFFWCIAVSGERKTATDRRAFYSQNQRERNLRAHHEAELEGYRVDHSMWQAQAKAIEKEHNKPGAAGSEAHKQALEELGPEPKKPLEPLIMSSEFTFEGLVRCLRLGQPLYGIIGSEGGQFIGGHGMTEEAKLRTITGISAAWDGEPIKRVRANETVILCGRRVGMHLMVQPEVAEKALCDELLQRQGFMSRIMVCTPESMIGTRMHKAPPLDAAQILQDYQDHVLGILEKSYPLVEDTQSELDPRPVPFSKEAEALFWEFADEIEKEMAPRGEYEAIQAFAAKLPEHAARLGAALAAYRDLDFAELSRDDFLCGMRIAVFYASEAKRISGGSRASIDLPSALKLAPAQKLLDWLTREWKAPTVSARDIYTFGPSAIRDRETAIDLAEILVQHGWLRPIKKNEWTIIRKAAQQ